MRRINYFKDEPSPLDKIELKQCTFCDGLEEGFTQCVVRRDQPWRCPFENLFDKE